MVRIKKSLKKVAVIGAGPIGCYFSYLAAKKGWQVDLFEAKPTIGFPIQCTGILTADIARFDTLKPTLKNSTINTIEKTKIFGNLNDLDNFVEFKIKDNFIIDRSAFDQGIAKLAEKEGVNLIYNTKAVDVEDQNITTINTKGTNSNKKTTKTYGKYDYIVSSDGPISIVGKKWKSCRNVRHGIQATVDLKNDNTVEFYPCEGSYAWIVPESKTRVRIGLVARKNAKKKFENFVKKRIGYAKYSKIKNKDIQTGLIPDFDLLARTCSSDKFLIGDAGGFVKASTGGGIIPGLKSAEILIKCLERRSDFSTIWRLEIGLNLLVHKLIRRAFDNMTEKEKRELIAELSKPQIQEIIEKHDREDALSLGAEIILTKPSLLKYALKAL